MGAKVSVLEIFAQAIETGDSKKVKSLIDGGAVDVNARLSRNGNPPALVHAVRCGQIAIVNILLRANALVDEVDDCGRTPCHAAAEHASETNDDMIALLLTRQPDLTLLDSFGCTSLEYSFRQFAAQRSPLALLAHGAQLNGVSQTDLCRFAATSTTAIQALVHRGVKVSELRDDDGATPLHLAARRWSEEVVVPSMLVNVCGVDLEARSSLGRTCTFEAAFNSCSHALRWLVAAGADIEHKDNDGSTPLHAAIEAYGPERCTQILLTAGADVHARNRVGRTPAHVMGLARKVSTLHLVHMLLACGANLEAVDDLGQTARQCLELRGGQIDAEEVDRMRCNFAKERLDFVRFRAWQVCIGLQSLDLDALLMCELLQFACGPLARLIRFEQWWNIAMTVKHFHRKQSTQ